MQACVNGCLGPRRDTGMYYGGEPAAWTTQPDIIPEALFGSADASAGTRGRQCIVDLVPVLLEAAVLTVTCCACRPAGLLERRKAGSSAAAVSEARAC